MSADANDRMEDIRAAAAELQSTPEPANEPVAANEPMPEEPANEPIESAQEDKPARARDEAGKFVKQDRVEVSGKTTVPKAPEKEPAKAAVSPVAGKSAEGAPGTLPAPLAPSADPASEPLKPPPSLTPLEREHFAKAPREIQQAFIRREREFTAGIQEHAEVRKNWQAFQQAVGPFEAMIRAEGGEPLSAVRGMLQTAAALRTAPPQHKAMLVAQMVKTYGVPIDALDQALAGETPQATQQPQQFRDPRFDQFMAQLEQQKTQREQIAIQRRQQELVTFAESHEFFEDVRGDMADIMEMAEKRGVQLSLDDAYKRAVAIHPEISKVFAQREAAKKAASGNMSTARSKLAASSVKSTPATVNGADHDFDKLDRREQMLRIAAELNGR